MTNDPKSLEGITLHPVRNTKIAAALLTVGVPFAVEKDPIANVYHDGKPYRPGMPGDVSYMMADQGERGTKTSALIAAYEDPDFAPAIAFDKLLDELVATHPEIGARITSAFPLALMAYLRGGHENRDRIQKLWQQAAPMVLIKKSESSWTLIHKDASPETRRRFGVR